MHCSGCGLILAKELPAEQCRCRAAPVLRVLELRVHDGVEAHAFVSAEGSRRRFVACYASEAMVRFLLEGKSHRTAEWEPLLVTLEEERLKSFAMKMGWVLSGTYRDPGPRASEVRRPFARIAADLADGLANTILVTDFARVARKDLHTLAELARPAGAELLSVAPHVADANLEHDNIDFEEVPEEAGRNQALDALWTLTATEALRKLIAISGWRFTAYLADLLAHRLGADAVRAWSRSDPACKERPWREVLLTYAVVRARRTGELDALPLPRLLACTLCRRPYLDSAIPARLEEMIAGRVTCCRTCLTRAFFDREQPLFAYRGPAAVDSSVDAESGVQFFRDLDRDPLTRFLRRAVAVRDDADRLGVVTGAADTWLGALLDTGLLAGFGAVRRSESFHAAADGHLATNLGVALLDNWLGLRGLEHQIRSRYPDDPEHPGAPGTALRADFMVGGTAVEFLGMRGSDEFDKRIEVRIERGGRTGTRVIAIYAEDLLVADTMERKMRPLFGPGMPPAEG